LVKAGDVRGLAAIVSDPASRDRASALQGILDFLGEHRDGILEARQSILNACVPLIRALDPQIRANAMSLATVLRDPSAPAAVVAALSDPSSNVRVRALFGVFHLQPFGCLDDVLRLLADEDTNVRALAAAAVERVGDRSTVATLVGARTAEKDDWVRGRIDEVVDILEGRRPPTPIEPFMEEG
jgi:HEAT repeat protein